MLSLDENFIWHLLEAFASELFLCNIIIFLHLLHLNSSNIELNSIIVVCNKLL